MGVPSALEPRITAAAAPAPITTPMASQAPEGNFFTRQTVSVQLGRRAGIEALS
jgi:hypothetical protein